MSRSAPSSKTSRPFQIALGLFQRGDLAAADQACRKLSNTNPDALHLRGLIADRRGDFARAKKLLRKAVKIKPSGAELHNALGLSLRNAGEPDAAVEALGRAIKLRPRYAGAWYNLGLALEDRRQFDQALEAYQTACEHEPAMARAHTARGLMLQTLGRMDEATGAYERALSIAPDYAEAHFHLAHARRAESADDPQLAAIEHLLRATQLSAGREGWLQSAYGKLNDDLGNYEQAFAAHRRANELIQNARLVTNPHKPLAEPFIGAFGPAVFAKKSSAALARRDRIFIVGMPRSGSTLLENMLAAHPDVEAGGERAELTGDRRGLVRDNGDDPKLAWASATEAQLKRAAEWLDQRLAAPRHGRYLTDKLPGNIWNLGLVGKLLPHAPILFTLRDPRDVGLSCYFTRFQGSNHPYSNDLYLCGRMIRATNMMIEHWRRVLPNPMRVVHYEKLVEDPKDVMDTVFAACGLSSPERAVDHMQTSAAVTTASNWQVRQKLYNRAIGRWRHYEDHLKPLLDGLGDLSY